MGLEHLTEPVGQNLQLFGPSQGGVGVESTSARTPSRTRSWSCCLLPTWWYRAPGTTPRRAAKVRMVNAWAPSWAMTASASATTRWRVSWGRRSWSWVGAPNQSERDLPSVAGAPDVAVARLLGGVLARSCTLPLFSMFKPPER